MPRYFNNESVESDLEYYQTLDPSTFEAKKLINSILKEVRKIIAAVMNTHGLSKKYGVPGRVLIEEALISCASKLKDFNPKALKASGQPSDLFTYMSIVAKNSMIWYGYKAKGERIRERKNITFEVADNAGLLEPYNQVYSGESIIDQFRPNYQHLFQDHQLVTFNLIADFIETDRYHLTRHDIVQAMDAVGDQFINITSDKQSSRSYRKVRVVEVLKKIMKYEQLKKGKLKYYENNRAVQSKKVMDETTGVVYQSISEAAYHLDMSLIQLKTANRLKYI